MEMSQHPVLSPAALLIYLEGWIRHPPAFEILKFCDSKMLIQIFIILLCVMHYAKHFTYYISFDLTSNPMYIIIPTVQMRKLKPTDPDHFACQGHNKK